MPPARLPHTTTNLRLYTGPQGWYQCAVIACRVQTLRAQHNHCHMRRHLRTRSSSQVHQRNVHLFVEPGWTHAEHTMCFEHFTWCSQPAVQRAMRSEYVRTIHHTLTIPHTSQVRKCRQSHAARAKRASPRAAKQVTATALWRMISSRNPRFVQFFRTR